MDHTAAELMGSLVSERRQGAGVSPEVLTELMRLRGVRWYPQTLNQLERGKRQPTVEEIIVLVEELNGLGARLTDKEVLEAARKGVVGPTMEEFARQHPKAEAPSLAGRDAERRMAKSLEARLDGHAVSEDDVREWSLHLWKHSLVDEREARLKAAPAEGSAGTRRGHVARRLQVELLKEGRKRHGDGSNEQARD